MKFRVIIKVEKEEVTMESKLTLKELYVGNIVSLVYNLQKHII